MPIESIGRCRPEARSTDFREGRLAGQPVEVCDHLVQGHVEDLIDHLSGMRKNAPMANSFSASHRPS
jgi:hypothetical protein